MHSIDYLIQEAEDKLSIVQSMRMSCEQNNQSLDSLKASIDKSISYHMDALKIRADQYVIL